MTSANGKFSGVDKIGQNFLITQLESNIKSFLDWGFLNIGGFVNVNRSINNVNDNPVYKLYSVEDPNYNNGQIWYTVRKDWVYESGINIDTLSPVNISGLYIGSGYYPIATTGTYAYTLDYRNSSIIFDNKLSTSANVTMNYSYRWVQVYNFADAEWWQEIQYDTDSNSSYLNKGNKGDFGIFSKHRVQFPAIVIETVSRGTAKPYRLGDKSLIVEQDFILHIVAENYNDRNNITDILRLQQDRVIQMYDTNKVSSNGVYPINFDGTLNNNRLQYDQLINNSLYHWNTCRLKNMIVSEVDSSLFECNIRTTAEVIFDKLM